MQGVFACMFGGIGDAGDCPSSKKKIAVATRESRPGWYARRVRMHKSGSLLHSYYGLVASLHAFICHIILLRACGPGPIRVESLQNIHSLRAIDCGSRLSQQDGCSIRPAGGEGDAAGESLSFPRSFGFKQLV